MIEPYSNAIRIHLQDVDPTAERVARSFYAQAREIAAEHPAGAAVGAGIIAALSPRMQWSVNVRKAREVFASGTTRALGQSVRAAERIHAGEPVDAVLKGAKTRAFARNCAGDLEPVTVDVWALRAAGVIDRDAPTTVQYRDIEHAYKIVARERKLPPAILQAIAWYAVRGIKPSDHEVIA